MTEEGWAWVPDRSWSVPSSYSKCRQLGCPNPPVADLSRWSSARGKAYRWAYCADHLYGRRVRNGIVWVPVAPDSPIAKRGWAG